ncbi:hypothetical protein RFI_32035 [Reticulomyxa filosa]|uniref:Uncharacterized protein n=1 Tax=Reticulomyxa filosa TaxID=46433 RepID=X6LVI9_RETFI|nr:hypothetical protein RFI_32035 [Reticulomyxa filosa]|eukprot:ETO05361.1 hypothetical protein RFI_32035 [Reticulomyxa filosa]
MKDVSRSAIIHDQFSDCAVILSVLFEQLKHEVKDAPQIPFNVVRIKNRYDELTSHGWGDIHLVSYFIQKKKIKKKKRNKKNLLCAKIPVDDNKQLVHICELQIIHRKMWDKRDSGMFGHKYYEVDRTIRAKLHEGSDVIGQAKTVDTILDSTDHVKTEVAKAVFVKRVSLHENEKKEGA